MTVIGELAVNVAARVGDLGRGLGAARRDIASFVGYATRMGPGIATAALGAAKALDVLAAREGHIIDQIAKSSDKLGIQTEELIGLQYAASLTANMVDTAFNSSLQQMVKRLSDAKEGSGGARKALHELGLSAEAVGKLDTKEQFFAIADAMSRVQNDGDRLRLTLALFGKQGGDLVHTLGQGRAGLEGLTAEGIKTLGVTREQAKSIEELNDRQHKSSALWAGMRRDVAMAATPVRELSATLRDELSRSLSNTLSQMGLVTEATRKETDSLKEAAAAGRAKAAADREMQQEQSKRAAMARGMAIRRDVELSDQLNAPYMSRIKGVKDSIATAGIENPLERELALLKGEYDNRYTRDTRNELILNLERLIELEKKHEDQLKSKQKAEEQTARAEEIRATALSDFKGKLEEIEQLRAAGKLTTAEAVTATKGLMGGLGGGSNVDRSQNALIDINSAEAWKAIRGGNQVDPIQKQQLEEQRRMKTLAEQQLEQLKIVASFQGVDL